VISLASSSAHPVLLQPHSPTHFGRVGRIATQILATRRAVEWKNLQEKKKKLEQAKQSKVIVAITTNPNRNVDTDFSGSFDLLDTPRRPQMRVAWRLSRRELLFSRLIASRIVMTATCNHPTGIAVNFAFIARPFLSHDATNASLCFIASSLNCPLKLN
jgi:hypothetical protein